MENQDIFKIRINIYNHQTVKMPSIKKFAEDRAKLKGFFTQVKIWINNKGPRLPTFMEKIVYTGMYLTRKPLK